MRDRDSWSARIYSRRVLRHASHSSIEHLRQRTEAFMGQRNQARSHTGRREPLPGTGDLSEVTALVVDLLAPCLDPNS
jgi:hypothetical protein